MGLKLKWDGDYAYVGGYTLWVGLAATRLERMVEVTDGSRSAFVTEAAAHEIVAAQAAGLRYFINDQGQIEAVPVMPRLGHLEAGRS